MNPADDRTKQAFLDAAAELLNPGFAAGVGDPFGWEPYDSSNALGDEDPFEEAVEMTEADLREVGFGIVWRPDGFTISRPLSRPGPEVSYP